MPFVSFNTDEQPADGGFIDFDAPAKPKDEGSDFTRGVKESFQQLPQLGYGLVAGAGAALESAVGEGGIATGIKKAGVKGYQEWGDKIASQAKESDSWSYSYDKAKEGDFGALVDWLQHGIGYVGGQGIQALASAGIGAVGGKLVAGTVARQVAEGMVAKEVAKLAAESGGRLAAEAVTAQATKNVAEKFAAIGMNAAMGGMAVGQEGGEIFGDLSKRSVDENRSLTGAELGKAFATTLAAGGLEFVGDRLGLDVVLGKSALLKPAAGMAGLTGRVARGGIAAAGATPIEAGTEFGQTLLEEAGKGNDPLSAESLKQARDAAALGALGGTAIGGAGGVLHGQQAPAEPDPVPAILNAPDVDSAIEAARAATQERVAGLFEAQQTDALIGAMREREANPPVFAPANDAASLLERQGQGDPLAPMLEDRRVRTDAFNQVEADAAQAEQRKAAEMEAIPELAAEQNVTQAAVSRAGSLESPTAMQLALERARVAPAANSPDSLDSPGVAGTAGIDAGTAGVQESAPDLPRIIPRAEGLVALPQKLAEQRAAANPALEVVRFANIDRATGEPNGKFAYTTILKDSDVSNSARPGAVPDAAAGSRNPDTGVGLDLGAGVRAPAGDAVAAGDGARQPDRQPVALADTGRVGAVEPAATWFGRRGDGYVTEADARMALPSRQRAEPDLSWKVEPIAGGKFRLAGYASAAVESGDEQTNVGSGVGTAGAQAAHVVGNTLPPGDGRAVYPGAPETSAGKVGAAASAVPARSEVANEPAQPQAAQAGIADLAGEVGTGQPSLPGAGLPAVENDGARAIQPRRLPEADVPAGRTAAVSDPNVSPAAAVAQTPADAGGSVPAPEVSRYTGKYGKGMSRDAAKLEAARLNRSADGVTYTAEEHGDAKLENPWAVVGRKAASGPAAEAWAAATPKNRRFFAEKGGIDLTSRGAGLLTAKKWDALAPEQQAAITRGMERDGTIATPEPAATAAEQPAAAELPKADATVAAQPSEAAKSSELANLGKMMQTAGKEFAEATPEIHRAEAARIDKAAAAMADMPEVKARYEALAESHRAAAETKTAAATTQQAEAILDAAGIKGSERLTAIKDIRSGAITMDELVRAHPAAEKAEAEIDKRNAGKDQDADPNQEAMFARRESDPEFRRGNFPAPGITLNAFSNAIEEAFGKGVAGRLQKNGVVIPLEDQNSLPEHVVPFVRDGDTIFGFYDPKTDRTYAVLSNLRPDMVKGLVIHEVGVHYGFEAMLGKDKYNQVINRISVLGKAGNKEIIAAKAEAKENSGNPRQVPEETLAYLVMNHPEMALVKEVIAKIKAFMFDKFGIGGKYLTVDDITQLAKAAVEHSSRTEPGERAPSFARGTTEPMASRKADELSAGVVENLAQSDEDAPILTDPSPEEASAVQAGIEGKSAVEAAEFIAANAPSEIHRTIATRVASRLRQFESVGSTFTLHVAHVGEEVPATMVGAGVRGQTIQTADDPETHVWVQGADVTGKVGTSYETVLHELVHAVTQRALDLGEHGAKGELGIAARELRAVWRDVLLRIRDRADAGELTQFEREFGLSRNNSLQNMHEMLTWALVNSETQNYLESVPYKGASAWSAFVAAIRRFLGLSPSADTALSEVLHVADKLLSIDAGYLMQEAIRQGQHLQVNYAGARTIVNSARSVVTGQTLPQTWQAPDASKLDDFIYSMQDKHIDTKRVMKSVRDAIGAIADEQDPYLQEELFHGRAAMATKEFLEKSLRPLLTDLQARGIDISDFEEYLHNRHAERRNVQVAKVNPNMPDGGSGIKTADARAYLAGLPANKAAAYKALARRVDQINKDTRDLLVSSGLEKQSTIDAWDAAYGDEYVPLMREEMDNGAMGIGQGFSVRGGSSKRAMGSDKPVANILANIALQREKAITRSEKRRIGEALYGLVLKAPNDDFWFAIDPALQNKKTPNQIMATQMQLISMGMDPLDAENIAKEPTQRYIGPDGQVHERINPALRSADNVLAVRIDGEDKYVFFNAKDERAMRMAKALKNLDADQLGTVMGTVAKMTRYFSAINTQYNPIFGVTNIVRDVQTAVLNLNSTALKDHKADVMKHILPALRGIYIDLRDHRAGKTPTSSYAAIFEEFQREGGATGYRDMYANAQERADDIAAELKAIKDGKALKLGKGIMAWLSDYNESMENAVRVAAYKVGKEQGMTNQQAASLAKNLTVNFNRKGQVALQAGALYAFFNASVQGSARIAQTLFVDGKLSSTGRRIITGGILLGSMQALLLAMAGFDDDEPPDFVRERSLVIPIGDKKYVSIPMPLGFHVLPNLGRIPAEWAMSGFKNTPKRIGQLVGLLADAFNPIGSAGLSLQTLTPTIIDPLAALSENKDFTGKPIAKKDFDALHPSAGHTRAKDTATPWAKLISYGMNMATGGTDYKPGLASPTPDQIDYLIGQVTGGVGREAGKLSQVASSALSGEELPMHKIPLVGRFVGTTEGQSAEASRFYNNLRQIGEHKAELDGLRKDRKGTEASAYLRENREAMLVPVADRVQREVSKLTTMKRDLIKAGASKERIKLLDMAITARMKVLNDRVRAMEKEPA